MRIITDTVDIIKQKRRQILKKIINNHIHNTSKINVYANSTSCAQIHVNPCSKQCMNFRPDNRAPALLSLKKCGTNNTKHSVTKHTTRITQQETIPTNHRKRVNIYEIHNTIKH
jgi:hypothetical protein